MTIKRIVIKKLYDKYDFDVCFNDSVNLLYGPNGCGKTTLLNIASYMLGGELYKFKSIVFRKIQVELKANDKIINYEINREKDTLKCNIDEKTFIYYFQKDMEFYMDDSIDEIEFRKKDIDQYPELQKFVNQLSLTFLPLDRINHNYYNDYNYFRIRSRKYRFNKIPGLPVDYSDLDSSINMVKDRIKERYYTYSTKLQEATNKFKNDLLSSLVTPEEHSIKEISQLINKYNANTIKKKGELYIKALENNGLLDATLRQKYDEYFSKLADDLTALKEEQSTKNSNHSHVIFSILELNKMEKTIKWAEKVDETRNKLYKPINDFCNIINSFFSVANSEKRIVINDGQIKLLVEGIQNDQCIDIENMSSGEKQLVIFFANLIFDSSNGKNSIVLIDEPELSLHLVWQKMFVEQALKASPNSQFIMATHSPEIVGKYRGNTVKISRSIK